jgi:hypothetical protein
VAFNTVTITTSATKIVSANPNRQSLLLSNTSAGTVYLGADNTVTKDNGIPLLQNVLFVENDCGSRMYLGDVWGIVTAETSNLRYWERTR